MIADVIKKAKEDIILFKRKGLDTIFKMDLY